MCSIFMALFWLPNSFVAFLGIKCFCFPLTCGGGAKEWGEEWDAARSEGEPGDKSFEDAPVSFKSDVRKHFGSPMSRYEKGEKVTGRQKKTHCADTARQ